MRFEKVEFKKFYEDMLKTQGWVDEPESNRICREAYDNIRLPVRATIASCGYDFRLPIDCSLGQGFRVIMPSGVCFRCDDETENQYYLQLHARSSLGMMGVHLTNITGIIDADYWHAENGGDIMLALENTGDECRYLNAGQRVAQGIIHKYCVVDDDDVKTQRHGGIGSTGK